MKGSRVGLHSALRLSFCLCLCLAGALPAGCGGPGKPPKRGVIEGDVQNWGFRRYQSVLDVEVWVKKNKGVAHTASYARKSAEKRGHIEDTDVVNAFVTRYKKKAGIGRSLVVFVRRMALQSGYKVEEKSIAGQRLYEIQGPGEYWVFWNAKRHVVKIGGRGLDKVPGALVEAYGERYASQVKSGSLEGPLPEGPEEVEIEAVDPDDEFDSDKPRPEWQ